MQRSSRFRTDSIAESTEEPRAPVVAREWPDGLFSCFADLPSCWFACWCPALTEGRALAMAGVTRGWVPFAVYSVLDVIRFVVLFVLLKMAFSKNEKMSLRTLILLYLLPGLVCVVVSSIWRKQLRERFSIKGYFACDLLSMWCCSCCAKAQESRAVALLSEKELDFCFDEPLKAATDKHVALQKKLLLPAAADDMETSPPDEASQGSWREHWDTLSAFSKRLLLVEAALFVASCLFAKSSTNALILLLSTIQPAVILYAVWWRSNRLDAEADLVVKYFSVGFFWTVLASAVVEVPVLLVGFALYFGALRDRPDFAKKMGDDGWAEELLEDLGTVDMAFIAFYVSFVVAAVVEEALKYAIVRFCPVSSGSSSPGASGFMARKGRKALGSSPSEIRPSVHKATLIYFVVGALGFTLSETIQAVVNKAKAPKFGDDIQLDLRIWKGITLITRNLLPVHVICAALQAANVVERDILGKDMKLYQILAVPVLLHGSFDFVLLFTARQSVDAAILGVCLSAVIMLCGLAWAAKRWETVTKHVASSTQWMPVPTTAGGGMV